MSGEREKFIYEYCLLRYVPDLERGEFINVGLLMMCKRRKWLRCEVAVDRERIERFCTSCEIERLIHQLKVFTSTDVPARDLPTEEKYRWMAAVKNAIIQTSPSHPGLIFSDRANIDRLLDEKYEDLFFRLVTV